MASQNGNTRTVRTLVQEFGADANTADNVGHTLVFLPRMATRRRCGRWCGIFSPTPTVSMTMVGLPSGSLPRMATRRQVRSLVQECGENVNTADLMGVTPVSIAAEKNHKETVRALLRECGDNVSRLDGSLCSEGVAWGDVAQVRHDACGWSLETCRGCAGPPGPDLAKRDLNPRIPARVRTISGAGARKGCRIPVVCVCVYYCRT
jgi:hypothetical protein